MREGTCRPWKYSHSNTTADTVQMTRVRSVSMAARHPVLSSDVTTSARKLKTATHTMLMAKEICRRGIFIMSWGNHHVRSATHVHALTCVKTPRANMGFRRTWNALGTSSRGSPSVAVTIERIGKTTKQRIRPQKPSSPTAKRAGTWYFARYRSSTTYCEAGNSG